MFNVAVKIPMGNGESVTVFRKSRSVCAAIMDVSLSYGIPPHGIVGWVVL
jgi:hypothetical protein